MIVAELVHAEEPLAIVGKDTKAQIALKWFESYK